MKRIVLICHKDHLISGSINFMKKVLEQRFIVKVVFGNQKMHHIKPYVKNYSDSVFVLWQTEFLAPWLTSQGIKVVVFPMYDGCANAPKGYFKILDHSYLFNFSKKLHKKCVDSNIISYQLTYYPEVEKTKIENKNDRLFYWFRRHNGTLSDSLIIDLFSPFVNKIHIHDRPDKYNPDEFVSRVPDGFISTSNWFEDKEDLLALVSSSKYFLAPRESEGIGMAFLEAMSLGCIVFANRSSTHDQYIYNGYNGFLIDFSSRNTELIRTQIKDAFDIIRSGKPIGENAKKFMEDGVPVWKEQSERLLNALSTISETKPLDRFKKTTRIIFYFLSRTYYKYPPLYILFVEILFRFNSIYETIFKIGIIRFYSILRRILKSRIK